MTNHHHSTEQAADHPNIFKLSLQATLHCLIGCGFGEIIGMIISTAFNISMSGSILLSVLFGFIGGLGLGILPLLKNGFTLNHALRLVIISEGLSILVMEGFEVATQVAIPGLMQASLTDALFWFGMVAGLAVGFVAALPVNYVLIKKGVRHACH